MVTGNQLIALFNPTSYNSSLYCHLFFFLFFFSLDALRDSVNCLSCVSFVFNSNVNDSSTNFRLGTPSLACSRGFLDLQNFKF
jgi:hypothetical protein